MLTLGKELFVFIKNSARTDAISDRFFDEMFIFTPLRLKASFT
ncbi:hypothetical protein VCHENC02_5860 [Vibrio harveyi]|uniref:Uncharacterized protein n=1 Tax=Vibrio harveyi TaxID=669 RepID=A0A454CP81_VIBHA|nr:hypothetical protein VCHENC02_5860 [Vibrio harveyi]